ncbi:MAG TPA: hypothetical protein VGY57_10275 [Vicinamibacterales bacterium]|nr:hypothetical protein [Vicinamibacterales bacterium]
MMTSRVTTAIRWTWLLVVFLAAASRTAAQPPSTDHDHEAPAQSAAGQEPAGAGEYPSLHISGFGDVNFTAQDKAEGVRGFSLGQFVLHMASALSPRVNFFGELSFSPRADAGTGMPPATGYNAEVERAIIRFDQSDQLKVSFGRYHTPVNWWNTAFHHGQWLQTTINRPEMVQFGGRFIPVHFIGALAEGSLPAGGWNIGYEAGVGNGRGNVISRGGDAGDNNARPAWVVNLFTKPDRVFGLQVGGSAYVDRVSIAGRPEFSERILAAHAVLQREDPEIIAEIANVRHDQVDGALTASSTAYYVQAAYRLRGAAERWKPYYRFEHIAVDATDPVFAGVPNLDGSTIGVRYDISTYAAIKTEARTRLRAADQPRTTGWFLQIAFTF